MPNGGLFSCMFRHGPQFLKGIRVRTIHRPFARAADIVLWHFRGGGPLKMNRQLTFWAAKRSRNMPRLPQGGSGREVQKMRSRQLVNIKLIEQLIKTPSSWRSSNTRRGASQKAKELEPSGIANAIKGAIANKEQLKTVGLTEWLTDWGPEWLTNWMTQRTTDCLQERMLLRLQRAREIMKLRN